MDKASTIQKMTERLLELMTFLGQVSVREEQGIFLIDINLEEPAQLIGFKGENLFFLQHLLRVLSLRKLGAPTKIFLDINQYRSKRIAALKELARSSADQVRFLKKPIELEPMNAFERRIIHMELATRPDVVTESIGQEPFRRIFIKPYP